MSTSARSIVAAATGTYQPSTKFHLPQAIATMFQQIRTHFRNFVLHGILTIAPTTGSTQATGAAGITVLLVNCNAGEVCVNGVIASFVAEVDRVLHNSTVYTGVDSSTLTEGRDAYVTIVAKNDTGTVTLANVKGPTATHGAAVPASDAQIQTFLGAGVAWIKVAEVLVYRDTDTTVAQTQSNAVRPILGVNIDTGFGNL
jgi:hypothetical protein